MADFVYFITSDEIGNQDPELGARLMHTFFLKLIWAAHLPSHILLMERGVLLLTECLCLDPIKVLEGKGVEILACQTCLDYYGIIDKMKAGKVSNMPDIIEVMQTAGKVIHL
jgi:sulfur relay (sulfurtransferase) complex TusBCD TusD component (DsrE family)